MMTMIRATIARAVSRLAYALAPTGSDVEAALRPIWRPGQR